MRRIDGFGSSGQFRRRVRIIAARGASAWVCVLLVGLPAMSSWSQSESLDSVDVGESRSLDDVEQAAAGNPDGDRLADSESLDEVPAASAESMDSMTNTFGTSLDDAPLAEAGAPDDADLAWKPTSCDQLAPVALRTPQTSDAAEGRPVLEAAQQRVASTKRGVKAATDAFGASLYRGQHLPATRVRLGEERDRARAQYSEARCAMQQTLEAARRAGVLPGVLRQYDTAID